MGAGRPSPDIIELLARNEEEVALLYSLYADIDSARKEMWKVLSDEELLHARLIGGLRAHLESGTLTINEGRFDETWVKRSIREVGRKVRHARSLHVSARDALKNACSIERSFVDGGVFKVYEADGPELEKVLQELLEGTRKHLRKVEAARSGLT